MGDSPYRYPRLFSLLLGVEDLAVDELVSSISPSIGKSTSQRRNIVRKISWHFSLMIILLFISGAAYGQSLSAGGLLYDKWWKAAGVDEPVGDQPLWSTQATNSRSGADTWRCKECHGWDYQGAAGAYGSGSHFTGFAGVLEAASRLSSAELTAWLDGTNNSDHDFSAMGDDQLPQLAHFLSAGLIDVAPFIDATTKEAIGGSAASGRPLYQSTCASCHGADGTAINFSGDPDDPDFVGTIATGNPWEFIHKVRAGQPGTAMPSSIDLGWSTADVVDLLTYSQSLPTKSRPPITGGFYGTLRVLESKPPARGMTMSGGPVGGRSEGISRSKPSTTPLRSWGQVKAYLAEEE
jgi:mono/diheme cytochrome c family protein